MGRNSLKSEGFARKHRELRLDRRHVEHANREVIDHFGEYLAIERPRRLAFTLEVPKHFSGITRVAIHISPTPKGCALELTQTGSRPEVTVGLWRTMLETLANVFAPTGRERAKHET